MIAIKFKQHRLIALKNNYIKQCLHMLYVTNRQPYKCG